MTRSSWTSSMLRPTRTTRTSWTAPSTLVDNGRSSISGRMADALYVSSHKIQKQYIYISTVATIFVHISYFNKLELYNGRCHKTRVGDEEREQDDDAEESETTGSTPPSTRTTPSSSWSRRRSEKHIWSHLMKDSELDGDMLHSKWWMMTHGIRSRVKDTLIVNCDVLTNNTKDDGTNKTLELFFLQKLY